VPNATSASVRSGATASIMPGGGSTSNLRRRSASRRSSRTRTARAVIAFSERSRGRRSARARPEGIRPSKSLRVTHRWSSPRRRCGPCPRPSPRHLDRRSRSYASDYTITIRIPKTRGRKARPD
jgi:hypothetical protein